MSVSQEQAHHVLERALADRYRIERELGGGGMSRVFLAREIAFDRQVVIKIIAPELRQGLSADRFARELQFAARLQQANIVPVLSAGDADGTPYYTMPYVDGLSLRARLERGPVPLGEALDIMRDIARALAYAHAQGVVHRDIKPENVLLSSGTAVVTDFGIAKALSVSRTAETPRDATLTQTGTSLGTPAYMAPEQALGEPVDERTDLYAWGLIAYEVLGGAHPFAAHSNAQRLVAAHLTETPASLAAIQPGVPANIVALVMQCLAKDPAARPAQANEILARLSAAVTPGMNTTGEGSARSSGLARRRWLVPIAVLVLALVVGGIALARRATATAPMRTVVVVPFDNVGNPADAYFAEGVSDEIASQLARLPGLQVIGRDGVQRFRGSSESPRDIARSMGAAWVLSGSVRWAHDAGSSNVNGTTRVRIVPALVNVSTGVQAWGDPFEEPLTDVFKVQADIAERVASALSVTLGGAARAELHRQDTDDPEARDAQLLGRYLLQQRGITNLRGAVAAFNRAIARDSNYARAWAGLAEATVLLPQYNDTTETDTVVLARAEAAARRAVAIDSTLPDVQLALARSQSAEFHFREALQSVNRVIATDPTSTLAYTLKYEILTALGRATAADSASRRAVELDGLSALALNNRAISFWAADKLDSAVHYSERAVAIDPSNAVWRRTLGAVYANAGRLKDARKTCSNGMMGSPDACAAVLGFIAGDPVDRATVIRGLDESARQSGAAGAPTFTAWVYARLGMPDSVFSRLAVAVQRHDDVFTHLITSTAFRPYESDPRWDAIVGTVRRR
ncbi:MAG: protein kinase [Gemmatimonadales bacterium]|jgi:serine/threonine-protein kinase